MFCSECGSKIEDNALFCMNCGKKVSEMNADQDSNSEVKQENTVVEKNVEEGNAELVNQENSENAEQPVSEPASQPMYAASEPASQPMYAASEPAGQPMYTASEPASQPMYGTSEPVSKPMYNNQAPQGQNNYGSQPMQGQQMYSNNTSAGQPMQGRPQGQPYMPNNTYIPQEPPKKKGKGCLIAAIIVGGICLILAIVVAIAIILGVYVFKKDANNGGGVSPIIASEEESDIYGWDTQASENSQTSGNIDSDVSIYDVNGWWEGTTTLISTSGASEMQGYLEDTLGYYLTDTEIAGLTGNIGETSILDARIYDYEGAQGSWFLNVDMGDYFGYQGWDDYDVLTYEEYTSDQLDAGCIKLQNGSFDLKVMEQDLYGEYAEQFFGSTDPAGDGAYGLSFDGDVVDAGDGTYDIEGTIQVIFQYGGMSEPYIQTYSYVLTDVYDSNPNESN